MKIMKEQSSYPSYLLENAVTQLAKLPGVGRKTAFRLALHVLREDKQYAEDLAQSLLLLRTEVKRCRVCRNISDSELCPICADERRDKSTVCVVESIRELLMIENTGAYKGVYHVLGGVISPMDGISPRDLEIESLAERVRSGGVSEVIFALSTTMEGDTTAYYIARRLQGEGVRLSAVARGVAIGDELQYADEATLSQSIVQRVPYKM